MIIKVRSRLNRVVVRDGLHVFEPGPHGDPEKVVAGITLQTMPRLGDQFVTDDKRAFSVELVEWRYDLGEVHLFCTEYPKQKPPVHSCGDPTNETACEGCIAEGRI